MGLFDNLFGKKVTSNHSYDRINRWIEKRIGPINWNDSSLQFKLEDFVKNEQSRYPSTLGKLNITQYGLDTHITGDSYQFKNRLRKLGCVWDAGNKCWVAKNKQLTRNDLDNPCELNGLKAYIKSIQYRKNLE